MAQSINVRLSDEMEKKIKSAIEDIKESTPLGAEVNNSTIVRGALEEFFLKIEERKKGINTIKYNVGKLSKNENIALCKLINKIIDENLDINDITNSDPEWLVYELLVRLKLDLLAIKTNYLLNE